MKQIIPALIAGGYSLEDAARYELLEKLQEEALEVAHAISKAMRFGLDSHRPSDPMETRNITLIENEIGDFLAVLHRLVEQLPPSHRLWKSSIELARQAHDIKLDKYLRVKLDAA